VSDSKSLGVIVAFLSSEGLAFFDLRWDGIPVIGLRTIPINNSRIGRGVNEVRELLGSTSIGIENAGKDVKADETGLVLHGDRIIADGAFVS